MHFTQHTDYALRILMYIGIHAERLVNITEIAEHYTISRSHLTKIVANLAGTGYLESIRGNKGGLRLKKDASDINIGEIIRRFEPMIIVDCMGQNRRCVISRTCLLKDVFKEATERFLETFDRYSLADLIKSKSLQDQLRV